jgi:hypothetical protein
MTLDDGRLKDAERLIGFAMVVTLCTAGISKLHSPETLFYEHLVPLFRGVGIWPLCPRTVAFRKLR